VTGAARISRRSLLKGATATATATAAASVVGAGVLAACDDGAKPASAEPRRITFQGLHQAGVTTPPPRQTIVAALDTTAGDRAALVKTLQALTVQSRLLMSGTQPPPNTVLLPPSDNGVVGVDPAPDDLTITVSVGASLFDDRYGLAALKPAQLTPMPNFPNDKPVPAASDGDLLVQVCSDTPEGANHALRRLLRATRSTLTLRWMLPGFVQPNTLGPGRASGRNLMGFKDGTANPDGGDERLMGDLVWMGDPPDRGEPAWTAHGSYVVVRRIRMRVEFWDRTALRTQETIIGRIRDTGSPLDGVEETDVPQYAADPSGARTPLAAHIRLANPRTPATEKNRILRRGYNFSQGFTPDGQLDQGLLFVCYQRSLKDGFLTVQERLDGEALEEYITPVGGGFFYVLPGVTTADGWLGQPIFEA
jgi:deferrochelatase/peroxidase EfeB